MVSIVSDPAAQSRDNLSLNVRAVAVYVIGHEHHRAHDNKVVVALCQVVIQAATLARLHNLRHEVQQEKPSGAAWGGG